MPSASVVRLTSALLPPTTPPHVVAPLELAFSVEPPSTVPPNVMLPEPVLTVVLPASVVTLSIVNAESVVVYVPLSVTVSSW